MNYSLSDAASFTSAPPPLPPRSDNSLSLSTSPKTGATSPKIRAITLVTWVTKNKILIFGDTMKNWRVRGRWGCQER
jgi:hypothetical protein